MWGAGGGGGGHYTRLTPEGHVPCPHQVSEN